MDSTKKDKEKLTDRELIHDYVVNLDGVNIHLPIFLKGEKKSKEKDLRKEIVKALENRPKIMDVLIRNVDIKLLKEQRDYLVKSQAKYFSEQIEGLINLLDAAIDEVEEQNGN